MQLNKIYETSCEELFASLDSNCADLVILDPPYNVGAASWDYIDDYFNWLKTVIEESVRILKPSGSLYLWGMSKNNDFLRIKLWMDEEVNKLMFKNWIVWIHEVKLHRKLKDRYLTKHEDLLFYSGKNNTFNMVRDTPPEFQLKMHKGRYDSTFFIERDKLPPSQQKIFKNGLQLGSPAKSWWKGPSNKSANKKIKKFNGYKSEWVCKRIIEVSSNSEDLVVVPFVGTGTECYCAKLLGRNFVGSEILNEHYIIANDRIESLISF